MSSGRATVTGKASDGGGYQDSDSFDVYGTATVADGKVTFQPTR
jgi:hypothetical protein